MIRRHLGALALATFAAGTVSPAFATHEIPFAPDADDRMWLSVGGTSCHSEAAPGVNGTPTCPGGGSASGVLDPSLERAHSVWLQNGATLKGGGSTSANSLAVFLQSNNMFGRSTAVIEDTYVLSGPAGDIDLGVVFSAEGVFQILQHPIGRILGQGSAQIGVGGGMGTNGASVLPILASASFETPLVNGGSPAPFPFELGVAFDLPVTVGSPFDLAFLLNVSSTHAVQANALNTALIDFVIPEGYALTSALGWTSPFQVGVPTPVPVPAAVWLFLPSLAALGLMPRRRG